MGSFFSDVLSFEHEVAIYDTDPQRLRFTFNTQRMTTMEEIEAFKPELLINAATVKYTIPAFESVLPHIPESCIISDIASVKPDFPNFTRKLNGLSFRHTRCSAPRLPTSAVYPKKMPSSSPSRTIWEKSFSKTYTVVCTSTSSNTHSSNTMRR